MPSHFSGYLLPEAGSPDRPPLDGLCDSLPSSAIEVSVTKEGPAGKADRGHIRVESASPSPSEQEGFRGYWLFVDDQGLQNSDSDLYAFQLLEFHVVDQATGASDARIIGYQETGAHGILEVELPDHRLILVPLIPQHATVDQKSRTVTIVDLASLDPDSQAL